ncbi:MAG: hypothetical protein JST20_11085 [Bacteroidetes bacterium]|nr:hypothetical protein [Bacteroidota bacterium]
MDDLIEISRLIASFGVKRPDSFLSDDEFPMITAFFNGLASGEFTDDEVAAQKLYGTSSDDVRYRKLKLRLRYKLYDAAIFINFEPPTFSTLRQKMYECNREQTAMKQCIENGAHDAGFIIAQKLLKKARKYHLTIVEIECLYAILNHIVACIGDEQQYELVSQELREAQLKLNAETNAEILFGSVSVKYAVVNSDHPENAPFILDCIHQFEELLKNFDTFKIRYSYFILRSWYAQIQRQFTDKIAVCDDAIEYFKNNPNIAGNLIAVFTLEKAECYLHLREYQTFLQLSKECESFFLKLTSNWLILKSYEVQALLSIGQLIPALELFNSVKKSLMRSGGGVEKFNEHWLVLEGYIYFFLYTQSEETLPENYRRPQLLTYLRKLSTTQITALANDKTGANLGIHIVHLLLLFALKSEPEVIAEKVVALDRYKRRYVLQESNQRTETFITMIRHFAFENFETINTSYRTKSLFQSLSPIDKNFYVDSLEAYELIPFDIIWTRIMTHYGVARQ